MEWLLLLIPAYFIVGGIWWVVDSRNSFKAFVEDPSRNYYSRTWDLDTQHWRPRTESERIRECANEALSLNAPMIFLWPVLIIVDGIAYARAGFISMFAGNEIHSALEAESEKETNSLIKRIEHELEEDWTKKFEGRDN